MRFVTKLGIIALLGTLTTGGFIGFGVFYYAKQIMQERIVEEEYFLAERLMETIDQNVHSAFNDARMIAADELLQQYLEKPNDAERHEMLDDELKERYALTGPWEALAIFDPNGQEMFAYGERSGGEAAAGSSATRLAFESAGKGKYYFSDPVASDISGKPALVIGVPVFSSEKTHQIVGILVVHYSWSAVTPLLHNVSDAFLVHLLSAKMQIIATNGHDIHTENLEEPFVEYRDLLKPLEKPNGPSKGYAVVDSFHKHVPSLAVYIIQGSHLSEYPGHRWILVLEQPLATAFKSVTTMAWTTAFVLLGGLLLLSTFYLIGIHRFMSPLTRLVDGVRRVAEGDMNERVPVTSRDEIGELAVNFNAMVTALRDSTVSQNELNNIFDAILGSLVILTPDMTISSINRATLSLLGFKEEELLGRPYHLLLPEAEELLAGFMPDKKTHEVLKNIQTAYTKASGGNMPILLSVSALYDGHSRLLKIICSAVDITERERMAQALRESEVRFRDLVETSLDWFWEVDARGRYTYVSPRVESILGYTPEEILGKTPFDLMPENERQRVGSFFEELTREQVPISLYENINLHKDGSIVILETSATPIFDAGGAFAGYRGIDRDITARKKADEALQQSELRLEQLAQNINEVFWSRELGKNAHLYVSPAFERIWGIPVQKLYEKPKLWIDQVYEEDRQRLLSAFDTLINGSRKEFTIEYRILTPDGKTRWIRDHGTAIPDHAGNVSQLSGIAADITDYKKAQEAITHQAFHDYLTGLPNREMLFESMRKELAYARRTEGCIVLMFIDLDDFKLLNDTLGHEAGDELLRQVSKRLGDALRETDLLARHGGDEFIIMMSDRKEGTAEAPNLTLLAGTIAERLLTLLKRPFKLLDQDIYIGASIGISVYPDDAETPNMLLQHADSAMYQAKELGRGRYQYYSKELSKRQSKRLELINRMHAAINSNSFILEYQPIVDLHTGSMVGVEALIRWRLEDGTFISPAEFIPLAEESSLIIPISEWVLYEACRQQQRWLAKGVDLFIAVNLSVRQFWQENLTEHVVSIIDGMKIPRERIELEVTETAMIQDTRLTEMILERFHEKGLRISLDDFGTGYSSLNRLKYLPIGKLKIDKSFVDGIITNSDDTAIVTTIIQLAHNLQIPALAEGIETGEQWRFLRELGCRYGQGYFFSPSLPPEAIEAILAEKRPWELSAENQSDVSVAT